MHAIPKWIGKLVLILLFSAIISYTYIRQAQIIEASLIRNQSTFHVAPYYALRFLLPSAIASVLPPEIYDTAKFRFAFAFIALALSFVSIERFRRRILNDNLAPLGAVLPLSLFVILLCHYCLTAQLNVYYVYDFPAILFYMISFLLLTSTGQRIVIFGILFTVLFSINRETIIIAPLHAAAFVSVREWSTRRSFLTKTLAPMAAAILIIILLRFVLAYSVLRVGILDTVSTDELGTPRFLANIHKVTNFHESAFHLLLIGAGAIVWLPLFFSKLSDELKLMLVFSVPAFLMLLWAGNFVELRIYNEFVPLLALLLSQTSTYWFDNCRKVTHGTV